MNLKFFRYPLQSDEPESGLGGPTTSEDTYSGTNTLGAPPTPPSGAEDGGADKLKLTLEKERQLRAQYEKESRQLKRQLEAFSGIDPEKAQRAEQILKEQEEMERKFSQLRSEVEREYAAKQAEAEKRAQEAQSQYLAYRKDVLLERAFYDQGGLSGEFKAVAHELRNRVQVGPDGEVQVLTPDGKPAYDKGEPMTLEGLFSQLRSQEIWFARHFKGEDAKGAGLQGGRFSPDDPRTAGMSDWEKVAYARSKNGGVIR